MVMIPVSEQLKVAVIHAGKERVTQCHTVDTSNVQIVPSPEVLIVLTYGEIATVVQHMC